jgi:methylase of polypeptide subunit release factors
MRLAYRALRVLSPSWADELHEASSELEVKAYERDLERVAHDDVPIAVQLLERATFFTLVLDEDPKTGLPEPLDNEETEEERVQRAGHPSRVAVWNLRTNQQLLRVRAQAAGRFVPVGEKVSRDPKIIAAQQRQANSCSLALGVKRALATSGQPKPASPAGQVESDSGAEGSSLDVGTGGGTGSGAVAAAVPASSASAGSK